MATTDIRLYAVPAGNDVWLYNVAPEVTLASATVYLFGVPAANDVWLYPFTAPAGGGFPTQYSGLRLWDNGAMVELCLVAEGDAPSGMGGVVKVRRSADTRVAYLVETTDPNASTWYVRSSTGTKAIRKKT